MSWNKLIREASHGAVRGVSVRVSSRGYATRGCVRIGRPTSPSAGFPAEKSVRVEVFAGDGEHAGSMKVRADAAGAFSCHAGGVNEALKLSTAPPPRAPSKCPSTEVEAVAGDGAVTFSLP